MQGNTLDPERQSTTWILLQTFKSMNIRLGMSVAPSKSTLLGHINACNLGRQLQMATKLCLARFGKLQAKTGREGAWGGGGGGEEGRFIFRPTMNFPFIQPSYR